MPLFRRKVAPQTAGTSISPRASCAGRSATTSRRHRHSSSAVTARRSADVPDALAVLDETTFHYVDVRGVSRRFDLELSQSGGSMIRRDDDFWQRSVVRFRGRDDMEGMGENSCDGGATWQHDVAISSSRIP